MNKRVTLFFGSFNPVHTGHIAIAEYVLTNDLADELWFIVSPQSPFKEQNGLAPEKDRLEMTRIAIGNSPKKNRMRACDIEFGMPKPSYTINTLERLWKEFPGVDFSILMGADNLVNFEKWRNHERIAGKCRIFVYRRSACEIDERSLSLGNIRILDATLLDISSTGVRNAPCGERERLLPEGVYEYIQEHGLYDTTDNR